MLNIRKVTVNNLAQPAPWGGGEGGVSSTSTREGKDVFPEQTLKLKFPKRLGKVQGRDMDKEGKENLGKILGKNLFRHFKFSLEAKKSC